MKDGTVADQNELIELIEEAGWSVSRVELSEQQYKTRNENEVTRVSIEILVCQETESEQSNPHRIK